MTVVEISSGDAVVVENSENAGEMSERSGRTGDDL